MTFMLNRKKVIFLSSKKICEKVCFKILSFKVGNKKIIDTVKIKKKDNDSILNFKLKKINIIKKNKNKLNNETLSPDKITVIVVINVTKRKI